MINKVRNSQNGLSLIELMIAITLGIIIAAAMISLFVNSKQSYRVNENMSRLQENARFAVSFISRDLRMADYRACVTEDTLDDAISGGTLNGSDTVTIIYQSNDCDTANALATTVYSIQDPDGAGPRQRALFRSVDGAAAQELVEGIENLQILFGEDTDKDFVPNYYVNAASIDDMEQAISVRFIVTARTLDTNIASGGGRISRDFTSTIVLRNRIP